MTNDDSFLNSCLETQLKTIETINREMKKPTDLERFIELYKSFGIELEATYNEHMQWHEIIMKNGGHEKFDGWFPFYTLVTFDAEGNFLNQEFCDCE